MRCQSSSRRSARSTSAAVHGESARVPAGPGARSASAPPPASVSAPIAGPASPASSSAATSCPPQALRPPVSGVSAQHLRERDLARAEERVHAVARRLVPQVARADVEPVDPVVELEDRVADRAGERADPPRRLHQRPLEVADDLGLERRVRAGAGTAPRPGRAHVDQPQLHAPVVVQVGDTDLAAERPRLEEGDAGEPARRGR